jgi:hypothetical protein
MVSPNDSVIFQRAVMTDTGERMRQGTTMSDACRKWGAGGGRDQEHIQLRSRMPEVEVHFDTGNLDKVSVLEIAPALDGSAVHKNLLAFF